ncbi:MAG: cellulase family glycosylhydrolase [Candidatus Acidiferrum sp.]
MNKRNRLWTGIFVLLVLCKTTCGQVGAHASRWTEKQANDWYAQQPWLVGSNYIPATAINQLEMWQAETFDAQRIDLELGWAESIGLNTMRVFLHDLPFQQDASGFQKRIDTFLSIAARHHIRILFVVFDSVWDPNPHLGKQHDPTPGVHNSGWVQSPGAGALKDPAQLPRLEAYVKGVVGAFANDRRVLGWDVWNEPSNTNVPAYSKNEPINKKEIVRELLPKVFVWAREAGATQPLTSGLWEGDYANPEKLDPIAKIQFEQSDVLSFHNYNKPAVFKKQVRELQKYHRPVICTEYMARPRKSTFAGILPIAKTNKVGAVNWGLVAGKTQTYLPWDSWERPYIDHQPKVWFHEIFHTDGTPYSVEEVSLIKRLTAGIAN